ncbi:hypothetical protein QOZ80_7BG0584100 [Eleusine coracana subsp. coracana]|nr:hypothetical protein QOZ80_7BG0584100 [Eleusine coracana subsp. coracana]
MEVLVSAVLGELTARSIDYFISRISKLQVLDVEDQLHRVMLRAEVIIEKAMGRYITNQAMLEQLEGLKDAMYRSYYMLDTFRYQHHEKTHEKDQVVRHSLSLSKINSLKGLCSSSRNTKILEQLQKALDDLSSMILDVKERVTFLMCYPRLICQPYSMHILLDNSMFGCHMEAEFAIKFLLHTEPHGYKELEVLPIVGPGRVGKSTLVAHVCKDKRISDHFSEIMFLRYNDFVDYKLPTFREGCSMKHQNFMSNSDEDRRLLLVVELAGDLNEDSWDRMYSASIRCLPRGSKIIITSRSDKIVKFGTTQALTLKYLSHEAYWYFFKTLAFGSMDPEAHPKLVHLAMEIARIMNGSLLGANATARLLRDNFDIHFWRKVLAFFRVFIQKDLSESGELPFDLINQSKPAHLGRMAAPYEYLVVFHQYECSSQEEVPKIRILDVVYGSLKHQGKFDALVWRSQIPPCYSYL